MSDRTHDTAHAVAGPLAFFVDLEPPQEDFRDAVIAGLSGIPKQLSPKYFYDKRGSEIFDDICRSEEYYVTRTEMALLKSIGPDVRELTKSGISVVEYGSGSSWKIRTLLDNLENPAEYIAIDISSDHLRDAATEIAQDFPSVRVGAICADFTQPFDLPADVSRGEGRRLGFLPGSTIGNFLPEQATSFLKTARSQLTPGGGLLIGVDLLKDEAILNAAYNDASGHTAAFNLNLLTRMREELGADVPVEKFEHHAFFNPEKSRIEMHLRASEPLTITLDGHRFAFEAGETIHTENSHKYTVEQFQAFAGTAGFTPAKVWRDPDNLFSLHYLEAA